MHAGTKRSQQRSKGETFSKSSQERKKERKNERKESGRSLTNQNNTTISHIWHWFECVQVWIYEDSAAGLQWTTTTGMGLW